MHLRFWLKYSCYQLAIIVGLLYAAVVTAQPDDQERIRSVMFAQWQRPDALLTADPVIVVGDNAIVGWTQGIKGGRALLRRQGSVWQVYVCGGDGLKTASALQQAGIGSEAARLMVRELAIAEASSSSSRIRQFSTFEGIAPVDPSHDTVYSHHD